MRVNLTTFSVIFVYDTTTTKHVGVPLSMMGDQDIQLGSDSFICTSDKRASGATFACHTRK